MAQVANPDYRENPDRAIYVTEDITQELVSHLSPEINRFRLKSSDPITIYVDSRGGSILAAENIRQLAAAPNPDGNCCRLITAATGRAASAAADLLALGDYAIAYPHAQIAYHGSRTPGESALTFEGATSLATSLQQTNEFFSVRLARRAFPRFVLKLTQLKEAWSKYRNAATGGYSVLRGIVRALNGNLDAHNGRMVSRALEQQTTITALSESVTKHFRRFKTIDDWSDARFQSELLKAVLKYKLRVHASDQWRLSEQGLSEVSDDFTLLYDFYFGRQKRALVHWVRTYGALFLSDSELAELKSYEGKPEQERVTWVRSKTEPKIQSVWYLIVSICRFLQTDDYDLSPEEAYWLGLVDEVPGSDLPNLRQAAENLPTKIENPPAASA